MNDKIKGAIRWLTQGLVARIFVALLLVVFAVSTTKINHDELAILTRFGKNVDRPLDPGLQFILPFFHEVRRYDTRRQFLLITDMSVTPDKDFQEVLYEEGIGVVTKDDVDAKVVLEVTYAIQKDECTIDDFVSTFGRSETEEGVRKIEKLIADRARKLARLLLNNVELEDAERRHVEFARIIREFSNGDAIDDAELPADFEQEVVANFRNLAESPLSKIGVKIYTLGYRIQPSSEFELSRRNAAIELESQRSRVRIAEEQMKADEAEHQRMRAEAEGEVELAGIQAKEFEASPESDPAKMILAIIEKWDGQLPKVVGEPESALLIEMSEVFKGNDPTSEPNQKARKTLDSTR